MELALDVNISDSVKLKPVVAKPDRSQTGKREPDRTNFVDKLAELRLSSTRSNNGIVSKLNSTLTMDQALFRKFSPAT